MARYYWNKKQRAEHLKRMSMSFFTRYGYLRGARVQSWVHIWKLWEMNNGSIWFTISRDDERKEGTLRVQFSHTGKQWENSEEFDYCIRLIATDCYFGWLRWWFLDPCDPMERKCSVLYMQSNGYFASHKTLNLSYDTQNEGRWAKRAEFQSIRWLVLYNKIKYQYRNGRPTRKMRRAIQYLSGGLSAKNYTADDVVKRYFPTSIIT